MYADEPPKLNLRTTLGKLTTEFRVGTIDRDQLLTEFRLIQQWEDAGLTVK